MMKQLLFILFSLNFFKASTQNNVTINSVKNDSGYVLLATNNEAYTVSIKLSFELNNMLWQDELETIVIPAHTMNKSIANIVRIDEKKGFGYSYKFNIFFGDLTISQYDTSYVYQLPFEKDKSFKLHQGYNGKSTHQNENSLDFTMPIGTNVLAARDGEVVEIVDYNNQGCNRIGCLKYNNYITIMHSDGTFAKYVHLNYKSSKVKVGDYVNVGDLIAESGNTGYTSGPHLHFEVNLPTTKNKKTIKTLFKIDENTIATLTEGNVYKRNY